MAKYARAALQSTCACAGLTTATVAWHWRGDPRRAGDHIAKIFDKEGMQGVAAALANQRPSRQWSSSTPHKRGPVFWPDYDREEAPLPKESVLFCGSSILREWANAPRDLEPLPVINRAFGGSRSWELDAAVVERLAAYKPRCVVYYCGSNDLSWAIRARVPFGEMAVEVVNNAARFAAGLDAAAPGVSLVILSVIKAPSKREEGTAEAIDAVNAGLRKLCEERPGSRSFFVDLNPTLEDSRGSPLLELYRDDGLHYHPMAYDRFRTALTPTLCEAYGASLARAGRPAL